MGYLVRRMWGGGGGGGRAQGREPKRRSPIGLGGLELLIGAGDLPKFASSASMARPPGPRPAGSTQTLKQERIPYPVLLPRFLRPPSHALMARPPLSPDAKRSAKPARAHSTAQARLRNG